MVINKRSKVLSIILSFLVGACVFCAPVFFEGNENTVYGSTVKEVRKTNVSVLNVRSKPSTSSAKRGTVKKGYTFTVKGTSGKWYKMTYKSKTSYVYKKYTSLSYKKTVYDQSKEAYVKAGPLNVRSKASTSSSKVGSLKEGAEIKITGEYETSSMDWYTLKYNGKTRYVAAQYVTIGALSGGSETGSDKGQEDTGGGNDMTDKEFKQDLVDQGFPTSYVTKLMELHEEHPQWIFKAQDTGVKWSTAVSKQTVIGRNLVSSSTANSWKSFRKGAYDYKDGEFVVFDGKWHAASDAVIKYYLDPRNFLTESYIYQFMDHNFDAESQTKDTIKSLVSKYSYCFMNTNGYVTRLYNAGKDSGVNPNVITAMVVMEQGWKGGSSLISGKYKGYEGIYNHFNIGAYTTSTMSSVERGLWWASGAGTGATSYNRPWNTIRKSLAGGAMYFAENYTEKNQNTLYTKKFNVANGVSDMGTHQYMTNVSGAASEGLILSYAYRESDDYPITFYIPVYEDMPDGPAEKPAANSKTNNNILDSITVKDQDGKKITGWSFARHTTKYSIDIPEGTTSVTVTAEPNNSNATVTGTGTFDITGDSITILIKVKAPTGVVKTYKLALSK